MTAVFGTVLVANRGEIAVRVITTLRRLGITSVAVFSDADRDARHVRAADLAVRIGPAPAADSYLRVEALIDAARRTGAEAVHPGYGFLSENTRFAQACVDAGIVFVGPPPHAIEVMGDKIAAKATVAPAGVPVVAGRVEPGMTDADLIDAAAEIGYPVLVKPSAGGGGKGMQRVATAADLPDALARARREAAASFGDDTLFVEQFVARPRHIEVQVLADTAGTVVHLGERECSLQRRHQKIVEEAPSVLLDPATRARIGASACATAAAVGYVGAGTVEFIVSADRPQDFFFMEMNTRLQVEHPVTEAVTGIDLVEQQLLVAAGRPLGFGQDDVTLTGHAVEARVYAEDPARGFLPTGGRVVALREPAGDGVRVDSSLLEGLVVGTDYDPMLSKVIAWGPDRATALARLDRALAGTSVLGFATNVGFLRALIGHPDVRAGRLDTELVEREIDDLTADPPPAAARVAYALHRLAELWPTGAVVDPWAVPSGWRPGGAAPLVVGEVAVWGRPDAATVRVGADGAAVDASLVGGVLSYDGIAHPAVTARAGASVWVAVDGGTWAFAEAAQARRGRAEEEDAEIRSPMPGTVAVLLATNGEEVAVGQPVVAVEAMKMEHSLPARLAGVVEVLVAEGDQVTLGQVLARVTPTAAP